MLNTEDKKIVIEKLEAIFNNEELFTYRVEIVYYDKDGFRKVFRAEPYQEVRVNIKDIPEEIKEHEI